MWQDFKDFISRGNVIDLAIGVIIGAAFTGIVSSLVDDMFMPIIGAILGGIHIEGLALTVGNASINYGNFLLICFSGFICLPKFNLNSVNISLVLWDLVGWVKPLYSNS